MYQEMVKKMTHLFKGEVDSIKKGKVIKFTSSDKERKFFRGNWNFRGCDVYHH